MDENTAKDTKKRGVAAISGPVQPRVSESATYKVERWHEGTPVSVLAENNTVIWELFRKAADGTFKTTNVKKRANEGTFTFEPGAESYEYRLEGYRYAPEGKGPATILIHPQPGLPRILEAELLDNNLNPLTDTVKYGQTIRIRVKTYHMFLKALRLRLWKTKPTDEEIHALEQSENVLEENSLIVTTTKKRNRQEATISIRLSVLMQKLINEGGTQEVFSDTARQYYLTVSCEGSIEHSDKVSQIYQTTLKVKGVGFDQPAKPEGRRMQMVGKSDPMPEEETLAEAYFGKKEYTVETDEEAGSYIYTFKNPHPKNSSATPHGEPGSILALEIMKLIAEELKQKRQYAKQDPIAAALQKQAKKTKGANVWYVKGEKVTFPVYRLAPNFKRIDHAAWEEKVYLVAKTYRLNGCEGQIEVKEKEPVVNGKDQSLPLLLLTEAQMNSTDNKVDGIETTVFKGKVEDGFLQIPVRLRPKSEDTLKDWKQKINKGVKDGSYTYAFNNENPYGTYIDSENKDKYAGIIAQNSREGKFGNPKLEAGKTIDAEDVKDALLSKTYKSGEKLTFYTRRKPRELVWLKASVQGKKKTHAGEYLKEEGRYFEIKESKICECEAKVRAVMRMLRGGEGTTDEKGYSRIVGRAQFSDYGQDFSTLIQRFIRKQ